MTDTITIRALGPEDVDVLDRVRPGTFRESPDPVHAWAFLTTGVNAMAAALTRGEVIGYATGLVVLHPDRPREFLVTDISVHPDFRGRGLGTRLIERLLGTASERGCETMALSMTSENGGVRRICEKLDGTLTADHALVTWDLNAL